MVMMEKELEKRNFLNWYCLYATTEEIEKAKRINKEALERLINEYSDDIEKINKSRRLYESISQSNVTNSQIPPASCFHKKAAGGI